MIYYLTHYISDSESKLKYCISPAGQNKSAYFADILSKSDLDYEIVSWAEVDSDQGFFIVQIYPWAITEDIEHYHYTSYSESE